MKKCVVCGKILPDDSKVCVKCGSSNIVESVSGEQVVSRIYDNVSTPPSKEETARIYD